MLRLAPGKLLLLAGGLTILGKNGSGQPARPADDCKAEVVQAFAQLSRQSSQLAQSSGVAAYRLLVETTSRRPGQRRDAVSSRLLTVATQRGNGYFSDGRHEVYSNATERVVVDHQQRTILLLDGATGPDQGDDYQKNLELIRRQLLEKASVQSCAWEQLKGQRYRRIVMQLPASLQAQLHVVGVSSLLTSQHQLRQTTMTFPESNPVHQVSFTVLPAAEKTPIREVQAPLAYIYQADHARRPEFAHYQLSDQRRSHR